MIRRKIPVVLQMTTADCGPAALAMVLAHFHRRVALDEVRRIIQPGRDGCSAGALIAAAAHYGLRARSVSLDIGELGSLPKGTILHWEFRHFVVLDRVRRGLVDIVDPTVGYRSVPLAVFRRSFTGVAISFEPTDGFSRADTRRKGRFRILREEAGRHRTAIVQVIGISILVQLLTAAIPLFTGTLIDHVVPTRDYHLLSLLAMGYAFVHLSTVLSGFIRDYLSIHVRARLEAGVTLRFLEHLIALPYSFFQQRTAGDVMMRLGSNSAVREMLSSSVLSTVLDGLTVGIYMVLLVMFSVPLAAVVVAVAATRLLVLGVMRRKHRELLAATLENQARSQTAQVEMLSGMEALKAMGLEQRAAKAWSNVFIDGLNLGTRRSRLDARFGVLLSLISGASTLGLLFYGAYLVLQSTWTLGSMMAFNALALGLLMPLSSLMSAALRLQMLEVYLERLNDVWDTPPEQHGVDVLPAGALRGAIELDGVSFTYRRDSPWVLRDISLTILHGSRIAIVGHTGSGKSSLARLIAGLYEPTSGRILLDGVDLSGIERGSVRRQFGIVTQDAQLFGGSIRHNIAFGDPDVGLDRVIRAAKLACLHDEIMSMPLKYETLLADRGLSLSGGQRQRLSIARALARDPKILVLDEATSHLDAVMEEMVNRSVATLRCTTIVIAHRLTTVQDADLIVVLDKGRIVELGRHDELMRQRARYAELARAQMNLSRIT